MIDGRRVEVYELHRVVCQPIDILSEQTARIIEDLHKKGILADKKNEPVNFIKTPEIIIEEFEGKKEVKRGWFG